MSETKNLAEALAKAQGQIQSAKKTSENPAFKKDGKASTYADIAEVIEVIQKPASDNGLSVIFDFKLDGETLFINYIILHTSGEKLVGSPVPMFLRDKTVHGFGASNTFMRRQLLKAIYQIPEEDDDGNTASGTQPKPQPPYRPAPVAGPRPQPPIPNNAPKLSTSPQSFPPPSKPYNAETYFEPDAESQEPEDVVFETLAPMEQLLVLRNKLGIDIPEMKEIVLRITGSQSTKDCDPEQIQNLVKYLKMKLK